MEHVLIRGGHRLRGEVRLAGSRSAALPIMAASLLAPGESVVENVPACGDVAAMRRILESLGARTSQEGATLRIDAAAATGVEVGYEAVRTLRAALLLLGPLLARHGRARLALPGGSALGARPIEQHLRGLSALGARIDVEHGDLVARAPRRLRGAFVTLDLPTVGGTENILLAAALARGRTHIDGAARDPEIVELARLLNRMGARVEGAGTAHIVVEGVEGAEALQPVAHAVPPDRVEAGTLLVAAALTRGDVRIAGCAPEDLDAVLARLRSAGATIELDGGVLVARGPERLAPIDLQAAPHPGFPTDLVPAFLVLAARAQGQSVVADPVFPARLGCAGELLRMGADLHTDGATALVRGPARLQGARVAAPDVRAASALCLAGLAAEGETRIEHAEVLDSAFERLDKKLRALGADITRAGA